jgi:hypothetical protein
VRLIIKQRLRAFIGLGPLIAGWAASSTPIDVAAGQNTVDTSPNGNHPPPKGEPEENHEEL